MRPGETCRLWVEPRYGYGDRGSFSFPTVPPNAHLVYDLDLLSYDPPNDDDAAGIRDLTYEERLEAAERRRGEGNDAFRAGNHALALEKYTTALSYVDEDLLIQLEGFHYDKAMECRTPALLNMAAVHRKTGDHHAAVGLCSQVLAQDPDNVKALFRRGSARLSLGQTEAAIGDLQAARKRDPDDPGIVKELTAAMGVAKSEKSAQREMFGGMIARAGGRLFADVPEKIEKEVFMDDGALPPWNEGGSGGGLVGSVWKWILGVLSWMFPFLASKALVTGKAHAE
jgi:tetratricopeptide (TPR) repeat protein